MQVNENRLNASNCSKILVMTMTCLNVHTIPHVLPSCLQPTNA